MAPGALLHRGGLHQVAVLATCLFFKQALAINVSSNSENPAVAPPRPKNLVSKEATAIHHLTVDHNGEILAANQKASVDSRQMRREKQPLGYKAALGLYGYTPPVQPLGTPYNQPQGRYNQPQGPYNQPQGPYSPLTHQVQPSSPSTQQQGPYNPLSHEHPVPIVERYKPYPPEPPYQQRMPYNSHVAPTPSPEDMEEIMQKVRKFDRIVEEAERKAGLPDTIHRTTTEQPAEDADEDKEERNLWWDVIFLAIIVSSFCLLYSKYKNEKKQNQELLRQVGGGMPQGSANVQQAH